MSVRAREGDEQRLLCRGELALGDDQLSALAITRRLLVGDAGRRAVGNGHLLLEPREVEEQIDLLADSSMLRLLREVPKWAAIRPRTSSDGESSACTIASWSSASFLASVSTMTRRRIWGSIALPDKVCTIHSLLYNLSLSRFVKSVECRLENGSADVRS